jgi:hypothetical protein
MGSILPSMECWEELMYLPKLIQHFEKHKVESNGSITFFEFMQMHYSNASTHAQNAPESEKHQHETLPSLNGHSLHAYVLSEFPFQISDASQISEFAFTPQYWWNNLYSFSHCRSMINPPNFSV